MSELPTEPLTRAEEDRLANSRSEEDRNKLVLHSMREAMAYAHRCCRGALEQDDLFSLCYDALQKAASRFKPKKIRFFAYAKADVRRAIGDMWRSKDLVRNSSMHEEKDFSFSVIPQGSAHCEDLEPEEILRKEELENIYLHAIPSIDPEFEMIHLRERWELVKPIIQTKLTDTERMVIDLHFNGDIGFEEIGELLGVCRERTRMIQFNALKKVRCELMRRKALFDR